MPTLLTHTDPRWQQILARDPEAAFLYAVRSTGIFCRAICPARRPAPHQVVFFGTAGEALAAGFRPCLRCEPAANRTAEAELAQQLAAHLAGHLHRAVPLAELARLAGLSPGATLRLFQRATGLSPRAWQNARRAQRFRDELAGGLAVTDAVYSAGFSAPSRAQAAAPLGMEPRRYRAHGAGERIGYTTGEAGPLGRMLVASTVSGICAVTLGATDQELHAALAARFRRAELHPDPALGVLLGEVLAHVREGGTARALPLDLRGTAFQARVWRALQNIPRGATRTYAEVAREIGAPTATRAVGAACGANPVALLVPCHRALASSGKLTGYRWGIERKQALLAMEKKP